MIGINVDCIAQTIDLTIGMYATEAAYNTPNTLPFDTYHAWPNYAALLGQPVDVRAASYEFLMTLPIFMTAINV